MAVLSSRYKGQQLLQRASTTVAAFKGLWMVSRSNMNYIVSTAALGRMYDQNCQSLSQLISCSLLQPKKACSTNGDWNPMISKTMWICCHSNITSSASWALKVLLQTLVLPLQWFTKITASVFYDYLVVSPRGSVPLCIWSERATIIKSCVSTTTRVFAQFTNKYEHFTDMWNTVINFFSRASYRTAFSRRKLLL